MKRKHIGFRLYFANNIAVDIKAPGKPERWINNELRHVAVNIAAGGDCHRFVKLVRVS